MKYLTKMSLPILLCAGIMSACQSVPESTVKNNVIKAEGSTEKVIENIINEYFDSSEGNDSSSKDIILNTPTNLKAEYKSKSKEIYIDAKIFTPDTKEINTYNMKKNMLSKEFLESIMYARFDEQVKDLFYDDINSIYQLNIGDDYFTLSDYTQDERLSNKIELTGHKEQLNPHEINLYLHNEEIFFSSEEAINKCSDLLLKTGLNEYKFYSINSYGKYEGIKYYKVIFKYNLNNMPVITPGIYSDIAFYVTKEGIYDISGYLYDFFQLDNDVSIISLESANQILSAYSDLITIYCNEIRHSMFLDLTDSNGLLNRFNIMSINLEYISKETDNGSVIVPAWRYYLSPDKNYIDKEIVLAVDAIEGEVIFR